MADTVSTATTTTTPGRAEVLALRRSPAHDLADAFAAGSGTAVRLREVPFLTQLTLRAAPESPAEAALRQALDTDLPGRVGDVTVGPGAAHVLWLGPDEFLVVAPDEAESGVLTTEYADRLAAALGDHRGQVIDVSANRTTFELSGPAAQSVLDKSVRIDLHPREFPVGRAVATQLGATPAILWRTQEDTWWILARSSFATHVGSWLLDGMREYG